jgi:short-subunit dehydrogenase
MHVAITGASSGIGAAVARAFGAAGASLSLVARRRDRLEVLAAGLDRCFIVEHDLSDPERAVAWLEPAQDALGPIDVLVNNAGVQIFGPTSETDLEQGEALLRTNLLTPLRLIRAVLPSMLARRSGTLVDIASMAALAPTPGLTWYNASKAGLAAASEALRGELRGTGVHVVTVYPGIIETAMAEAAIGAAAPSLMLRLQPRGDADELARRIRRAVERRKNRVIYPRFNALARWFPTVTRWLMDRYTPRFTPVALLPAAADGARGSSTDG